MEDLNNIVEAIMFALGREISVDEISKTLEVSKLLFNCCSIIAF